MSALPQVWLTPDLREGEVKLLLCAVSSGLLVLAREEQLCLGWRPHRWLAHRGVSVSSPVSGLACS